MTRFSIILATIALTSCARSPSTVSQIPPEEVHMPIWEDHWNAINFVDDESTEAVEPKQLRSVLQKSIESHGYYIDEFWRPENAVHAIRKLPDGSVLVVGEMPAFVAPGWVLHFSATGSLLKEYMAGQEFVGYAKGFVYTKGGFGDGGGYSDGVSALDLESGKNQTIYQYDTYLGIKIHLDPYFIPKNCEVIKINDESLHSDVEEIARRSSASFSKVIIGIPCAKDGMRVIPFAVPSSFHYGVGVRKSNGEFNIKIDSASGGALFPPLYYEDENFSLALGHVFVSSESGSYSYSQHHYLIHDGFINSEQYIKEVSNVEFCRLHQCPKRVREVAGKNQ